jgi:hypothetical protein
VAYVSVSLALVARAARAAELDVWRKWEAFAMTRFFTCYWLNRLWKDAVNPAWRPLQAAGSNKFRARCVQPGQGHFVYVITIRDGHLYLGGRMTVSRIVSRSEAVQITGSNELYDADEWVIDDTPEGGTPLHLYRRLAPEVTHRIVCLRSGGEQGLKFLGDGVHLDGQALRGVVELTPGSARLFDRIIAATDELPHTDDLLTVTVEMLQAVQLPGG